MSIVNLKTFGAIFTGSLSFWADGTKAHNILVDVRRRRRVQISVLKQVKLLFDLVVHQQQHLHCFWQHSNSFGEV